MTRQDFNLIASCIRESLAAGEMEHSAVRRFLEVFVRTHGSAFNLDAFLRAALLQERRERSYSEILRGLRLTSPAPPTTPRPRITVEEMNQTEFDGAVFKAILDVRHPSLSAVRCAYSSCETQRFTISRMGIAVVIRFGPEALSDMEAAVEAAAPDAERMLLGTTTAVAINGRTQWPG